MQSRESAEVAVGGVQGGAMLDCKSGKMGVGDEVATGIEISRRGLGAGDIVDRSNHAVVDRYVEESVTTPQSSRPNNQRRRHATSRNDPK